MEITKKISGCQMLGVVRMNRQSTDEFGHNGTTVYDRIMVDTCHNKFVQTHRMGGHKL